MKIVTMHEAKTNLSRFVDMALAGEEIVIARRKLPLVKLSIIGEKPSKRKVGTMSGVVLKMGKGFNEPLDGWEESLTPGARARKLQ